MSIDLHPSGESIHAMGPFTELQHHILTTPLSAQIDHESNLNLNSLHKEHGPQSEEEHSYERRKLSSTPAAGSETCNINPHSSAAEVEHGVKSGGGGDAPEHAVHDQTPLYVCLFIFIMMFIGQLMKQFSAFSGIPYTSLITVIGVVFGICTEKYNMDPLGKAIEVFASLNAHLILLIFLPALIFESAFNSDWHIFKVELYQILIMAGPMLLGSTCLTALVMTFVFKYDDSVEFNWYASLMYGAIISATDPVAVVALLKELGASKRLSTMIEGESLLNDGTAFVVFLVLLDFVIGEEKTVVAILGQFIQLSFGGILFGLAGGMVTAYILSKIHNNGVLEANTTIFCAYMLFFVAETNIAVSGILTIVAMGLYMSNIGKTSISTESEHALHHVWGFIGFVAETVIFILSGIILGQRSMEDCHLITYIDYLKLLGIYVCLHFVRFFMILVFWPILRKIGYGMSFKQVLVVSYAGLRGAVGLALALIVTTTQGVPRHVQDVILLQTGGIALLTLLINATTTGTLVRFLGLSKQSDLKKNILVSLTRNIDKNIDQNIEVLKQKKHFNNVDWKVLRDKVRMHDLKNQFKQYANLHLHGKENPDLEDVTHDKTGRLNQINEKIQSKQKEVDPEGNIVNLKANTTGTDTFKGQQKKEAMQPTYNAGYDSEQNMDGEISEAGVGHKEEQGGNVDVEELITELRHKYITILKSLYWEHFEEGQCQASSVTVLIESADRALDHENQKLQDWDFIESYILSDRFLKIVGFFSKFKFFSFLFRKYLFDSFSRSYDIIVNFIDAHEEATKNIQNVIENKHFVDTILGESQVNTDLAEQYMITHIEDMFPEIAKAIQMRRAQYFLLIHEYHYVDSMLKVGQIEDKEAQALQGEIDKMIINLENHDPEIELKGQKERIMYYSVLSEIFDREELSQAFQGVETQEEYHNPKVRVVSTDNYSSAGSVYYVARGICIEKDGEYEDKNIPHLKYTRGQIGCLQNLLPDSEKTRNISDLYCHNSGYTSIIPLNLNHLKYVLEQDPSKLLKLWQHLSFRFMIIASDKYTVFKPLTPEKVKQVAKICEVKIYQPESIVDVSNGGCLMRGGLSKLNKSEKKLTNRATLLEEEKLNKSILLNKSTLSAQMQTQVISKKKEIADLGAQAKNMNLHQDVDEGEFKSHMYIPPNKKDGKKLYIARSKDYTVFVHFPDQLRDALLQQKDTSQITQQILESVMQQHQMKEFKKANMYKQMQNMPQGVENLKPGMTFTVKKSGKHDMFDFDIVQPGTKDNATAQDITKAAMNQSMGKGQTFIPIRSPNSKNALVGMAAPEQKLAGQRKSNTKPMVRSKSNELLEVEQEPNVDASEPHSVGDRHDMPTANAVNVNVPKNLGQEGGGSMGTINSEHDGPNKQNIEE